MANAEKRQDSEAKKGGNKTKFLIIGGAVVIVALVVVVAVLANRLSDVQNIGEDEVPLRNVVVNEENVEDVLAAMRDEPVAPGSYEVIMNTTWIFRDGTSVSENAYVENAATNTNDVYFDVELADTGEVIYESPVLPLGSHISSIALDKALDAGTYNCVLTYHLVDANQRTLSTLGMTLVIVVQN